MSEKVLITGASGFIGHHLVREALLKGYEVHAAVRPSSDISSLMVLDDISTNSRPLVFVYPDYSSTESLISMLQQGAYNYIIHAAGVTRAKSPEAYNSVNAKYSLNLAKGALEADIPLKRFVFMSSLAALGPIGYDESQPIAENSRPNPVTSYGKSKLLAETLLLELMGLPLTIIRPTAVYGPGEKDIFIVFQTLSKWLDVYIGSKPQRFSFVYAKDLVDATLAAMTEKRENVSIYNISDGQEYDRYELANLFGEISGKKSYRVHLPVRLIRVVASLLETFSTFSENTPVLNKEKINELTAANWNCSIEAARENLDYLPKYNLRKGLVETLGWYKEHKWL